MHNRQTNYNMLNKLLLLLALLSLYFTSQAQKTFDGGPTGTGTDWNTDANWNPDGVPGYTEIVTIDGYAVVISSITSAYANTVNVVSGSLRIDGNLTISDTPGVTYPEEFGAIGNGVTDDYEALVSFFNAITGTGIKGQFKTDKTYLTSKEITHFIDGDFDFDGNGSTIAREFSELNGKGSTDVLEFRQPNLFSKDLVQGFDKGAIRIKLNNTSGIMPGMGIYIFNGYWMEINGVLDKELVSKVASVDADNWITLESPSPTSFAPLYLPEFGDTSPDDDVQTKVVFYSNHDIEIKNLTVAAIGNPGDLTDNPAQYHLMRTNLLFDPIIENCTAQNGGRTSFAFSCTYGAQINGLTNNYFDKNVYGVFFNSVGNSTILNSNIQAYSCSFASSASCNYENVFDNIRAESFHTYAFDTHGSFSGKVLNSELHGVGLSSGDWYFDNCQFIGNPLHQNYFSGVTGSGTNPFIRLNVIVENSEFFGINSEKYFLENNAGPYEELNSWKFVGNTFRTEEFRFLARNNHIYENNVVSIGKGDFYPIPNSNKDIFEYTKNSYYSNFTTPAKTSYDIGGVRKLSGIAKIKTDGGVTDESIFGANVGQYFSVRIKTTGRIQVQWRDASDNSYHNFTTAQRIYPSDNSWRTVGFVLENISGTIGECKLYIDGKLAHVEEGIYFSGIYDILDVNLRLGGSDDGPLLEGSMESALFFEKALTQGEMSYYSMDLSRGLGSEATLVMLENKTSSMWKDQSGNAYDAQFSENIFLHKLPYDSDVSFYYDFSCDHISTTANLNGISEMSALVKAKFLDGGSSQCLLGEETGNIFFFRLPGNNSVELKFKNAAGENPLVVFENAVEMDTLWHTYGFTLGNNLATLYVDGVQNQTVQTSFDGMQAYDRFMNIGQRGTTDGVNGCIASVLLFDDQLDASQMALFSEFPCNGTDQAMLALLEGKCRTDWEDESGNNTDVEIGSGIALNSIPIISEIGYYSNFTDGNISTSYNLRNIPAMSALVKAKFDENSNQCLLGEASGNTFSFLVTNNTIEINFKNSDENIVQVVFDQDFSMDTPWHTFGFTLGNDVAKLYIDGQQIQVKETAFSNMVGEVCLLNIGQKGDAEGVKGSIASVLIFEEQLTCQEMDIFTESPSESVEQAKLALIDGKTCTQWIDKSSNGNDGFIGEGIVLHE